MSAQVIANSPGIGDMLEEMSRQRAVAVAFAMPILLKHGWRPEKDHPIALATKAFDTAAGAKTAVAYLGNFDMEFCNCTLSADYQSEGRNAAATAALLIPRAASAEAIQLLVEQFASNVDEAVAETYAARLYTERPRSA